MDDFVQDFVPELAQVCVAKMAIPKPDHLSIDCVAIAIFVKSLQNRVCMLCLPAIDVMTNQKQHTMYPSLPN